MGRPRKKNTVCIDTILPNQAIELTPKVINDLLSRIETVIEDTCIECGYDQSNIKATNWAYILYQIARQVFSLHPELLFDSPGKYNIDNFATLYEMIYSPLCDKYGTIKGELPFCKMLGIEYQNLMQEWERRNKLTKQNINLRQKILSDRKESITNNMINSNTNPIKYLSLLNHEYGFNETRIERVEDSKPVLSLDDIPELPDATAEKELPEKLALPNFDDDE